MADLLTHVLVAYVLATVVRWVLTVSTRWVPVVMGGAVIPDLVKLDLLLSADLVSETLGVPFSYSPIGSVGGVLLVAGMVALLFEDGMRRRAYVFLVFGGTTSLVVDGLRAFADGYAGFWLYPLWIRPPTPSLYVSSDYRVLLVTLVVTGTTVVVDRYRGTTRP